MPMPSLQRLASLALVGGALLALPRAAVAQDSDERRETDAFTWSGSIPSGRWIYLRNLNGPVRV